MEALCCWGLLPLQVPDVPTRAVQTEVKRRLRAACDPVCPWKDQCVLGSRRASSRAVDAACWSTSRGSALGQGPVKLFSAKVWEKGPGEQGEENVLFALCIVCIVYIV